MQQSVGGSVLSSRFWREFVEIENVAAIKIAPFDRYQTLDVMRAVCTSKRAIPVYTGNDDNIVMDLLTPYVFSVDGELREIRMRGGLLGHWAVWTREGGPTAGRMQNGGSRRCWIDPERTAATQCRESLTRMPRSSIQRITSPAALSGLNEVLQRQGLLDGIWCLDPDESLSPGQKAEIDRVYAAYPHLNDDEFVRAGLDEWLSP
jgi:hypothetical protein